MIFRASLTSLLLYLLAVPSLLAQERNPKLTDRTALQKQIELLHAHLAALLKENAAVEKESKPPKTSAPPISPAQVRIFTLRHTDAAEATQTLRELFEGAEEAKLRIVYHQSTNSVIARGIAENLEMIETILNRLDIVSEEKSKSKTDNNPTPMQSQKRIEELQDQLSRIQTEVDQWKEWVAWSERMSKKGYLSATQVEAERGRLKASEHALERVLKELQLVPPDKNKGSEKEKKSNK